jgi:hypothetical protein
MNYREYVPTEYRDEQFRVYNYLKKIFPNTLIKMEYPVNNLKPYQGIDLSHRLKRPKLDIAILSNSGPKIAIRMQGPPHNQPRQVTKDEDQAVVLRWNLWKVIDLWYDQLPLLWSNSEGWEDELKNKLINEKLFLALKDE